MSNDAWEFERKNGYLVNTKLIESASELFDCVDYIWEKKWVPPDSCNANDQSPWFRGMSRTDWGLIPSIYREEAFRYEKYIRSEFPRRAIPFLENCRFYSTGEIYHIMQHYGLPTRLLDWTEGLLFALYFAIREKYTGDKSTDSNSFTPCIWMMNPWWLNEKSVRNYNLFYSHFGEEDSEDRRIVSPYFRENDLPRYPIAILPPHIDKRITAQKSVFTIHGSDKCGLENLCASQKDAQLVQMRLDGKKESTLKDQLITAGITETSVFPDLEGLAREIKREYDLR
jgi:hypothetical protein